VKKAAVPSILVVVVLVAVAVIAEAQQTKNVPRVGYLALGAGGPGVGISARSQRTGLC
jgi:hypothetical protein